MMIEIDDRLIEELLEEASVSPRLRQNRDLRTTQDDYSQRMLNALHPGTTVPIHRHPNSTETVILLRGKIVEVMYEEVNPSVDFPQGMDAQDVMYRRRLREVERYVLDSSKGCHGCIVPKGTWHTVEVMEPSVIFEAKDGRYGEDGSENW